MGYKYIVKSYRWTNGIVSAVSVDFDNEQRALEHARAITPAETIKVYVEDEVIYAVKKDPESPMYAG
jgi:hypothetical protein